LGVTGAIPDAVVRALNEIEFVLTGDAAGQPVFHRSGRVREFELYLTSQSAGLWRARVRVRHPGGPWEWVRSERFPADGSTAIELKDNQLAGYLPFLLEKHVIPGADRTAFGD
jgi:hypothetical protein